MPHRSRSALRVQAQALVILGTTLSLPGASLSARMGRQPTPSDTSVAGIPATVVRPTTSPPWPALVFMNGATPDGRNHATVRRLGVALARAGVVVFIPELPGVAGGALTPDPCAFGRRRGGSGGISRHRRRSGRPRRGVDRRNPRAAFSRRPTPAEPYLGSRLCRAVRRSRRGDAARDNRYPPKRGAAWPPCGAAVSARRPRSLSGRNACGQPGDDGSLPRTARARPRLVRRDRIARARLSRGRCRWRKAL